MSSPSSPPSPQLFFQTMFAFQRTAALKAAIELDLFTAVQEGKHTVPEIAQRCRAAERGIRILADFLAMLGFLAKEEGRYALTPDSATFLVRGSHAYMGGTVPFLLSAPMTDGFQQLTEAVRKGGTVVGRQGTIEPDHPAWVDFARSMVPMMAGPAAWIAEKVNEEKTGSCRILDIAAGHGLFGIEIAKRNPQAEIVALDWGNVLAVAQERAQAEGVGERYRTIAGSAFDVDFGKDYDVILLTNFLHHFDVATCESLLRKVHHALSDGGWAVTLEFVPHEDRISPESASFGIVMLATTPAGDAYTFKEYDRMFTKSGFSRNEMQSIPMSTQAVILSYK